jgi:hypothetical protein
MGNRSSVRNHHFNAPGARLDTPRKCNVIGVDSLHLPHVWNVIEDKKLSFVATHKDFSHDFITISVLFNALTIEQTLDKVCSKLVTNNEYLSLGTQKATINGHNAALEHCSYTTQGLCMQRITCVIDNGYPMRVVISYTATKQTFDESGIHELIATTYLTSYDQMKWNAEEFENVIIQYPFGFQATQSEDEVFIESPIQSDKVLENICIQEITTEKPMKLKQQMEQVLSDVATNVQKFKREKLDKMIMCGKMQGFRAKMKYELNGRSVTQVIYITGDKTRFLMIMYTSTIGDAALLITDRIARSLEWAI